MSTRYLTPTQKLHELERWEQTKRESLPPTGKEAGYGYVDTAMIPVCDDINARFAGVVTLQSCAGHWSPEYVGESGATERTPWPGELWLWFTESMAREAYIAAPILNQHTLITRVQFVWISGQEIMTLQFKGEPDGQLSASVQAITEWLKHVTIRTMEQMHA
jgi:hypothetical protein